MKIPKALRHMGSFLDNKRDSIQLRQERSLLIAMMLAVVWLVPNLLLAIFSDSMLMLSNVPDNARLIIINFISWRVLRSIRLGRLYGFDYGTGKLQIIIGFVSSMAYIASLLFLGVLSVHRILNPAPLDSTYTAIAAAFQLVIFFVTLWLWRSSKAIAAEQLSPVMEMQWRTNRADALSGLLFAVALALCLLLKQYYWSIFIDPVCAILFVVYVIISFLPIINNGLNDILDKTLQEDLQLIIDKRLAEFFNQFDDFHSVRSRRSGERIFIEIALSFAPEQCVSEVSQTIGKLCASIEQELVNSEVRVILVPCRSIKPTNETSL